VIEWQRPPKRRRNDKNLTLSESIALLTDIIFHREIIEGRSPIFSFSQFRSIIEDADEQLGSLFDELEEASCIKKKNEDERKKADRSLAYQCYLMCWNRNKAIQLWDLNGESVGDSLSWVDGVKILTKLLYNREKVEKKSTIYSFKCLREEAEKHDSRLSVFFDSIYNATHPATKSDKSLDKLDRRLAFECYLICGNRNSKITAFKEAISYFVDLMRVSTEAIDALSHAGITISRRHLDRQKAIITDEHQRRVASYIQKSKNSTMVINIDDYHNIHAKRMPDTCSTSTVDKNALSLAEQAYLIALDMLI
jgi:hypothetical protein